MRYAEVALERLRVVEHSNISHDSRSALTLLMCLHFSFLERRRFCSDCAGRSFSKHCSLLDYRLNLGKTNRHYLGRKEHHAHRLTQAG